MLQYISMKKLACILLALCLTFGLTVLSGCTEENLLEFVGLSVEDETFDYDEQYHSLTLKGIENYPDATVKLDVETVSGGQADEYGEVGVGGVYTYVYTVSKEGYKTATVKGTLTINKIDPRFYIPNSAAFVWDDDKKITVDIFTNYEQSGVLSTVFRYNGEIIGKDEIYKAGDYTVTVTAPETACYNAKTETIAFTVYEPVFNVGFYVYNPVTGKLVLVDDDPSAKETFVRQISHNEALELEGIEGSGISLDYTGYNFDGWFVGKVTADGVISPTDEKLVSGGIYKYNEAIKIVAKFTKL